MIIQDSAEGIANELLSAGLIMGDDLVAMAGIISVKFVFGSFCAYIFLGSKLGIV